VADRSAQRANRNGTTEREPQPEHLNGKSTSGGMLPSRLAGGRAAAVRNQPDLKRRRADGFDTLTQVGRSWVSFSRF
jgi:hypothetical protein